MKGSPIKKSKLLLKVDKITNHLLLILVRK